MEISKFRWACLAVALFVAPAAASAAPNCNPQKYGKTCFKCTGWIGMSAWEPIACSHSNETPGGIACTKANCGLAKPKPMTGGPARRIQ